MWEDGDRCSIQCVGGAEVLAETSTRLLQETIIMDELGSGQFVRISTRARGDRCPGLVTCGSGIGEPLRSGCAGGAEFSGLRSQVGADAMQLTISILARLGPCCYEPGSLCVCNGLLLSNQSWSSDRGVRLLPH